MRVPGTILAPFRVIRNRVEDVNHVALYLTMGEGFVTHDDIIDAVDCVEGARQLLRIVDGRHGDFCFRNRSLGRELRR